MAGGSKSKAGKGRSSKETTKAEEAESSDDEEWVLDTTTPVVLDPVVTHVPVKKTQVQGQVPNLNPLPREKETDEGRTKRMASEKKTIDWSIRCAELTSTTNAKLSALPYGQLGRKKSHWDYLLCEMRWMARDFASERDWKLESARRCGAGAVTCNGAPQEKNDPTELLDVSRRRRCALVATEVSYFWEEAWVRATNAPLPPAAALVPRKVDTGVWNGKDGDEKDADEKIDGADKKDEPDTGRPTRGGRQREDLKSETKDLKPETKAVGDLAGDPATTGGGGGGDVVMGDAGGGTPPEDGDLEDGNVDAMGDAVLHTPQVVKKSIRRTPCLPPGVSEIEQWAFQKLTADIARLKKQMIRDAIREKSDEEELAKNPLGVGKKGGGKKLTAAEKKKFEKEEKELAEKLAREKKKLEETKEAEKAKATTDVSIDIAAENMPPPEPITDRYLPGGVPDEELDARLDFALVAPGTPPRFSETDPEKIFYSEPLSFPNYPGNTELFWRNLVIGETRKFAVYELSLRDWEEREKRRQRALAETRRRVEENAQIARVADRRNAAHRALLEAKRFENLASQRIAAELKQRTALGKRGRAGGIDDEDSSDEDEDGVTLAALAGRGGKKSNKSNAGGGGGGDKKKSHKAKRARAGQARPWTPTEDQLLCAIVHEFGSNWGLITDVFAASAPFKGTYRRAEQCRWRFQALTRSAEEGGDPAAAAALNLDKGTARQTISRALPVEDNTARMHFDRAAQAQARHAKQRRFAQQERAGDDANRRAAAHASWGAHRGLRVADPVEIADAALMEAARAAQAQQQQRRQQMGVPAGQGGGASIGGQPGGGQMGNQPGGSLQQRPGGPTMTPHVGAVPGGGGNRNTGVGGGGQVPQGQPGQAQMMPMQGQGQGGGQGGGQGNANNNQQYQMQMQQQQQMQRQMQQQQQRQQQMQMQGGGGGSGRPMQIPQGGGAQGPGAQGARQANSLPAPGNKPGGVPPVSGVAPGPGGSPSMGATYQPIPGTNTVVEMPTIPVATTGATNLTSSPGGPGGKGGAKGKNAGVSPGLAPGSYALGGGRSNRSGAKDAKDKGKK